MHIFFLIISAWRNTRIAFKQIEKLTLFILLVSVGCRRDAKNNFIEKFIPITNLEFQNNDTLVSLQADLSDAVLNGIQIPTVKQTPSGKFIFQATLSKNIDKTKKYFYKIYYQNTSYTFSNDNSFADENFYGSWESAETSFKEIPEAILNSSEPVLQDSFAIVGNPRNEKIYYGSNPNGFMVNDEMILDKIQQMRNAPEWLAQVAEKAKKEKRDLEEQLFLDAIWMISYDRNVDTTYNNRWKRNPRVGEYEFMLVISTKEDLGRLPEGIKNISVKNKETQKFENPFSYFLSGNSNELKNTQVVVSRKKLRIKAKFDLGAGIYIDRLDVNKSKISKEFYSNSCGDDKNLYQKAQFQQHFHYINKNFVLRNIPEVKDVVGDNVTREEYLSFEKRYKNKQHEMYVKSSDCPCKTTQSDSVQNKIVIYNPGCEDGDLKKEHVGIKSRIGFTYGKWRAKIKFPEIISQDNVWNGLTNAYWLIYQNEAPWNIRRVCNSQIAYIPKYEPDNEEALKHSKPAINYSEIDFEILKESQYWPKTSYQNPEEYKTDDAFNSHDIMVTCTNWDMACHEPKNFGIGVKDLEFQNQKYTLHRWNDFYKALTTKVPRNHDELFKAPYYYFEIDWQPDKIIWRIGPSVDKMKVICVMTDEVSAIPNNQMLMVVTQEFHNQEWYPTAPFKQNFVPFPKKNLVGEILEVVVE